MPIIVCGETTSKLSGPATSNYEWNCPPLFYVENKKISVYVESPHEFNIFFWESGSYPMSMDAKSLVDIS